MRKSDSLITPVADIFSLELWSIIFMALYTLMSLIDYYYDFDESADIANKLSLFEFQEQKLPPHSNVVYSHLSSNLQALLWYLGRSSKFPLFCKSSTILAYISKSSLNFLILTPSWTWNSSVFLSIICLCSSMTFGICRYLQQSVVIYINIFVYESKYLPLECNIIMLHFHWRKNNMIW